MNWIELSALNQLEEIKQESAKKPVLIFKHSHRCNISRTTLDRLERNWNDQEMDFIRSYFLDLISHRNLSNHVAEEYKVEHESPQVLVIENGKSILDLSHFEISYDQIRAVIKN
jgi:bacillithiol system protein YtxJ